MSRTATSLEVERRALALFEALADAPDDAARRRDLTVDVPPEVLARLDALEAGARKTFAPLGDDGEERAPPSRLGPFRLVRRVGRGGMGEVWEGARADGLFEQRVAVKFLQPRLLARAGRSFEDERRFLARLEHPGIARLIDGGATAEGLPWLAMEFVDGKPLDQAVTQLSLARRIAPLIEAGRAVSFAHAQGVAHGDLKPANILVGTGGAVKLLDFGIARMIDAPGRDGPQPLTRDFASPERLAGAAPSVADDVYALGRTLAHLVGPDRQRELAAIVARATAAPAARYPTVDAFVDDLARWRAGEPVRAVAGGWAYRAIKLIGRNPRWMLIAGVLLVLLGGATLVAQWNGQRAERRTQEIRQLAGTLLFRLYDDLARQPGTAAQRARLARDATGYLDELAATESPSIAEQLDTVRGYRRLAAVEGIPGIPNLGDPAAAKRALDRAASLLAPLARRRPDDPLVLNELGWLRVDQWSLNAGGRGQPPPAPVTAERMFAAALARAPELAEARLGLLAARRNRAYDLLWTDDRPGAARAMLTAALAQWRRERWPPPLRERAALLEVALLNRLGDAIEYDNDVPGALRTYQAADAAVDRLIAVNGPTPQLLLLKGENAFNVSGALEELPGRRPEALRIARQGDQLLQQLLASGIDAAAEKRLLMLKGQEANLLVDLGRVDEALIASRASAALRRARLARSPDDPQRLRDLAIGLAPYARILAQHGDRGAACAAGREALSAWRRTQALGQLGTLDARKNLPDAVSLVASFCPADQVS